MASIYDIDLGDTVHLEGLQEQAREILMLRHLQTMHETKLLQAHKDSLESRTRELEERNRRDNLTKLYNRSYLDRAIKEEFEAAKLHGWPLTVVFIDLDYFKQVNDSHGHQAGDVVLKNVANILVQQARGGDVVSRYGGEEFVIILPGTGREGAALLGERVLTGLRRATHSVSESEPIVVTASIGIAIHGEQERFQCCGDLVRAADRALYAAKLSGRDRLVFYHAPVR